MSEFNKSYRIKANVGGQENIFIETDLTQDYETLDILSIKIKSVDTYRLHNSNYGVVVGRVLANNGFGIPNAKLSIFIKSDTNDGEMVRELYPFSTSYSKDNNDVRYNLLPDEPVNDCHQVVGTFPNKRYMLDNDVVLEVFDKYYKYTTRTNNAGDYIIMGVPVGNHTLHMDLDLSDCGILSQKPRDFIYKGYTVEQFENPTQFKKGTNYSELSQIFTQDRIINVIPFWGNASIGESIGITRADIDVAFKFEPTCVFIGSVVSDNSSNGITKKCKATENMGNMEELTTGEGTIEMIRKTPSGDIESFAVRGNQLINGNGVWCYQIPMNLDYMMTDEYGNMVPTNDPEKGIPTRTSVRFRISMQDNEENLDNFFRCKVLVPHNPQFREDGFHESYDYEFGSFTSDESFRDLFWDNVYTVKSYIPRFQKKRVNGWKDKEFTGIKSCNFHGSNNPIPYNNMRIKLPLMFTIMCAIIKCLIFISGIYNLTLASLGVGLAEIAKAMSWKKLYQKVKEFKMSVLSEGLCPDLENWYFAPVALNATIANTTVNIRNKRREKKWGGDYNLLSQTLDFLKGEDSFNEPQSIDYQNKDNEDDLVCITTKTDYLIACIEMNLAMEYRVINFDFYNDWINGLIYIPRFMRYVKPKKNILGFINVKAKTKGCMDDTSVYSRSRRYAQQCALEYDATYVDGNVIYTTVKKDAKSHKKNNKANKYHKKRGFLTKDIFEERGGICHEHTTSRKQHVYYMKPCEWLKGAKANLYATDIVLLGSLKACDENGLPQAFKYLSSTSYVMPTNLALTNMETNGYLYVNDNRSLCAGKSSQSITDIATDNGVQRASSNLTITEELDIYSKTGDPNFETQFRGDEMSDVIQLTEAAGISWNYTGPGQGEINMGNLYYPGGHFLGMSCANSQTNIKSCVNLSRICEIGVTMSQRKEDVYDIDGKNAKYVYTVPSGFISGNEINGEDFRTMFATMNQKRLQATKLNMETGYDYYNFQFVRPINFDGTFSLIASAAEYNKQIDLEISSDDDLKRYGISRGIGYDYDEEESINTQTRTIEDASIDYYRFRFGLDYEHLTKKSKVHNSRFLLSNGNIKYLPQYENSYYFYFGLKAGATAIDEFNKQFYSTCETSVIARRVPSISVNVENINMCEMTGDVSVVLDNVEMPLSYVKLIKNEEGKVITKDITDKYNQYYVFSGDEFSGMSFADYRIVVMDENGVSLSTDFSVGTDLFEYVRTLHNFNVNDAMEHSGDTETIWRGGYISIDDVQLDPNYSDVCSSVTFIVKAIDDSGNILGESGTTQFEMDGDLDDKEDKRIYVKSAYTKYNLYIQYDCDKSDGYGQSNDEDIKTLYLETFTLKDGSSVSLVLGRQDLNLYTKIEPNGISETVVPSGESATTIEIDNVSLNFGDSGSTKWWENTNLDRDDNNRIGNWLKRLSIQKSTEEGTVFTNNIVAIDGNKVIWGVPQNYDGKYTNSENTIFCSEDNITDYSGYSLDDDASYYGTDDQKHYSAIAVNDDLVSGDYFAYLSGNTSIILDNCTGYKPAINTGYVFKSLPDNELYFYTYNGSGEYEYPSGATNGVFYASFEYPVIEKPFEVDSTFYIWGTYDVYMPENVDNIAEVRYTELAGRTEVTIKNGIRYNGKLGLSDNNGNIVDDFSFSNILPKDIKNLTGNTIIISGTAGMNVTVTKEDRDGNVTTTIVPAYEKIGKITIAKGVTGVTDASYEISEGYPDGNDNYPLLVNSFNGNIDYSGYFGEMARYEFYNRRGLEIYIDGVNGKGSGNGMICYQDGISDPYNIITLPTGNNKYIYINTGTKKEPIYHILCEYKYFDEANEEGFKTGDYVVSPPGGLCFMTIRYHNPRRFQMYFEYGHSTEGITRHSYYAKENTKSLKYDIDALLNYKSDLTKSNESYFNDWKEKGIYPLKSYKLNVMTNWVDRIKTDETNYYNILVDNYNGDSKDVFDTDKFKYKLNNGIFYYVDKYPNENLYKIYPLLREQKKIDDGIKLDTYYINGPFEGGEYVLTINYTIDKYDSAATTSLLECATSGEALTRLLYQIDGIDETKAVSGISISGGFYKISISSSTVSSVTTEEETESFNVEYKLKIVINPGNSEIEANDYKLESIYFYITNKGDGERLDIERYPDVKLNPTISYKNDDIKGEFELLSYEEYKNKLEGEANNEAKINFLNEWEEKKSDYIINNGKNMFVYEVDDVYSRNDYIYALMLSISEQDSIRNKSNTKLNYIDSSWNNISLHNEPNIVIRNGYHAQKYKEKKIKLWLFNTLNYGITVYDIYRNMSGDIWEDYEIDDERKSQLMIIKYAPQETFIIIDKMDNVNDNAVVIVPWIYYDNNIYFKIEQTFETENQDFLKNCTFSLGSSIEEDEYNYEVDLAKTEKELNKVSSKSGETFNVYLKAKKNNESTFCYIDHPYYTKNNMFEEFVIDINYKNNYFRHLKIKALPMLSFYLKNDDDNNFDSYFYSSSAATESGYVYGILKTDAYFEDSDDAGAGININYKVPIKPDFLNTGNATLVVPPFDDKKYINGTVTPYVELMFNVDFTTGYQDNEEYPVDLCGYYYLTDNKGGELPVIDGRKSLKINVLSGNLENNNIVCKINDQDFNKNKSYNLSTSKYGDAFKDDESIRSCLVFKRKKINDYKIENELSAKLELGIELFLFDKNKDRVSNPSEWGGCTMYIYQRSGGTEYSIHETGINSTISAISFEYWLDDDDYMKISFSQQSLDTDTIVYDLDCFFMKEEYDMDSDNIDTKENTGLYRNDAINSSIDDYILHKMIVPDGTNNNKDPYYPIKISSLYRPDDKKVKIVIIGTESSKID